MIQIRKHTYRGTDGFLVCGKPPGARIRRVRIFTETRSSAERIKRKVKAGQDIGVEDFKPRREEEPTTD